MLCMTVFQSSTDICRRYIHYTEPGRSDSVVFKCTNISDVNIENFFEIVGIQLSADIIFTAYSLYICIYILIIHMNIEKIFEILRNNTIIIMLCITGIQLSAHRYYLDRVFIIHCH
jgi:hypothetical protein